MHSPQHLLITYSDAKTDFQKAFFYCLGLTSETSLAFSSRRLFLEQELSSFQESLPVPRRIPKAEYIPHF